MNNIKLAVVGSRTFTNYTFIKHHILRRVDIGLIDRLISGGAEGTDTLVDRFAKEHGLVMVTHYPKRGGQLKRNRDIVNEADKLLAFWDGTSTGTAMVIAYAKSRNKPITVVDV